MNLPNDIKQTCLWIVRGQKRRKKWYNEQIKLVMNNSLYTSSTYKQDKEKLKHTENYKYMKAVELAIETIGSDICTESKERLRKAILLNCESGRKYPFERLDTTEFSRRDFYRRKEEFLIEVAKNIGFL